MLDDLLQPGPRAVIVGTAAGSRSAQLGYYYAGRGNKFWNILHETGITPRVFLPNEFRDLLSIGIGLTDIVKIKAGMDKTLNPSDFNVAGFLKKVDINKPRVVCFNGKKAAQVFFNSEISYGLQPTKLRNTMFFVAHSTSGAANGPWMNGGTENWRAFAKLIGTF